MHTLKYTIFGPAMRVYSDWLFLFALYSSVNRLLAVRKTVSMSGRKNRRLHAGGKRCLWCGRRIILPGLLALVVISFLLVLPFRWLTPPSTAFMQHAKSSGLGGATPCAAIDWRWINWAQISPQIALAVIAAEDQRFPDHWGLDPQAISSAWQDRGERRMRGGSTVTQQLVKNLYLWPGQSWLRKAIEAWLALIVESSWPKQRILEVYLNVVQFDACTFGVETASRRYFDRSARYLSASQAASLVAVLPNPVRLKVDDNSEYLRNRRRWIQAQMQQLGGTDYLRNL